MKKRFLIIVAFIGIIFYCLNYNVSLLGNKTIKAAVISATSNNTSPTIEAVRPLIGQSITKGTVIIPKCTIQDIDGDNLTVKYYVDAEINARETKLFIGSSTPFEIAFTYINTSSWLDGNHSIKFEVSDGIAVVTTNIINFTITKAKYYYNKYNSQLQNYNTPTLSSTQIVASSNVPNQTYAVEGWSSVSIDYSTGEVKVVGSYKSFLLSYGQSIIADYSFGEYITYSVVQSSIPEQTYDLVRRKYVLIYNPHDVCTTLVQSNIIADDGTYPVNGKHTDGFWYIKMALVNTVPTIESVSPKLGQSIQKEAIIIPRCVVQDAEGNNLTVKYYVDIENVARESKTVIDTTVSQAVTFSDLNIIGLLEGNHSIKFEASDGITSPVSITVNFVVDNINQIIDSITLSSTEKTISIESLLPNNSSEMKVNHCRFSIGSNTSNWINTPRYTFESLIPNTSYTIKSEFQNAFGNSTTNEKRIYTKAQLPILLADNVTSTTIDLKVVSENPEDTQYQIMCDSMYVDSNGTLTEIPTWITVPHKILRVVDLSPGSCYNFKIKAKNMDNIETTFSSPMDFNAQLETPSDISTNSASTSVVLTWNPILGVYEYEVEADGVVKTVKITTYKHTGLIPDTQHSYRIRAKNAYGTSDWSKIITAVTNYTIPENIVNLKAYQTSKSVTFTWDETMDAQNYDVEFDGVEIDGIKGKFYTISGLKPNTEHLYQIRAVNSVGEGNWSGLSTVKTFLLDTVDNIKTTKGENYISLTWDKVMDCNTYTIEANGQIIANTPDNTFKHEGLNEDTKYVYRIKAVNSQGESAWTNEVIAYTLPVRPSIPENLLALSEDKGIVLMWNPVTDAIGYDVELDGVLIENGNSIKYVDEELNKSSMHKYRVRAKNASIEGEWTDYITVKTMAGRPEVPGEIKIESTPTITTLTWEAEDDALGYDIEIDGAQVETVTETSYRHKKLIPGSEHVYRIRTRNVTGVSQWSGYIINNSLKAICKKGMEVDLGLTATDIVDFSKYTLTVVFNPDVIALTDLSTFSSKIELSKGKIEGTGITITDYMLGKIVFVVDKTIPPGESWTGVINSIKFKAKVSGGTSITYTVFSKPEE